MKAWNTSWSTAIFDSSAGSTQMGPSKVGDAVAPPRSWTTSGSLFRGFSQEGLPHKSSVGHSGYLAQLT